MRKLNPGRQKEVNNENENLILPSPGAGMFFGSLDGGVRACLPVPLCISHK